METPKEVKDKEEIDADNDNRLRRLRSSILSLIPDSTTTQHDPQTFRTALVHSAAILFVLGCGVCALFAYRILEPFLRSILWSILAGAFLFPFKNHLTGLTRHSLRQLDTNSYLLFYGIVILLPLKTIDRTIDSIGPLCLRNWKELVIIFVFLPTIEFLQTGVIYRWITTIGSDFINHFVFFVHFFDSLWVATLVLPYLLAVLTIYHRSETIKKLLNILAIPIWFISLIYLSQFLPVTYRLIVLILSIVLTVVGFVVDIRENIDQSNHLNENPRRTSIFSNLADSFTTLREYFRKKRAEPSSSSPSASSTPYFTFILWLLLAIKVYQFYQYLIAISVFVIIYKSIKFLLIKFYNYLISQETVQCIIQQTIQFLQDRRDVLTPSPLHGLVRFLIKGDKKFNHGLQSSIDYLVSAFMIVTLFVTVLFGSILLIIQIQHESIHMVQLTSNLINEAVVLQPSFQHMLPEKEHMGKLMDSAVTNLHSVGKTWIIKQVNALDQDSDTNSKLEKDVLQLWDHLYNYMSNTSNLLLPDKNMSTSMSLFANHNLSLSNFDFHFHLNDIYSLIRNNLGVLRTVFDSIWTNTTLFLTLLSTILSFLFTGGFALLNFFVSFIVFVTLLFYLLSHSDRPVYQPTEWLNNSLAIGGKNLGKAVNDAVTSVFVASLKIAAFYGLYTYVLHTIVGSNLVFLPAVIASICAVTLKSYWAALPGCLDLWLVQQRPLGALLLLLGQIAPTYVVDTSIYSEVKGGGHQYLTALAIAGGVYYRGIEGALIGPIVLCCLLVGVRLYNETMATTLSSNSEEISSRTSLNDAFKPCSPSLETTLTN